MLVPECLFLRILKMKNENFSSYSVFISVGNWKQFFNPVSTFIFLFFFVPMKIKIFQISFFQIFEKKKLKCNEFIFQFSKKINKMEILFISSLFNFLGKKWKLKFFCEFNFHCFFNVVAWSTTRRWKNAPITRCLLPLQTWLTGILLSTWSSS